jgi:hypothetical protein
MANNNPEEQVDALINSLGRLREQTDEQILAQEGYQRLTNGALDNIETQSKRRRDLELKVYKEIEEKLGKEKSISNKRTEMFAEQLAGMNRYIDSNNKIIKTSVELGFMQRQQIASIKRADEATSKLHQAQNDFVSNLGAMAKDITKGLGNFALSVGNGSTSFTTLNPLIDIVANSMGALAKAIPFVGEAAAAAIKAGAEASKFVLELMDKNIKAFQDIANSGGLVADGMEGVSRQFLDSGMSLEGFKKAIKDNAGELAQWGQTVGGGATKFTKAVGMLTKDDGPLAKAGMDLRKLGMTADDIGTASAGFLQQELRLGRGVNMSTEQLAKGTAKYAMELDALQKVTGLSKEDLIKQRNEMLTDSRFSASMDVLRETNETGAEAIMQFATTIKDPELKRGFMDLTSGAGNTEAAKKAMRVMGDTMPDIIEKLKNSKPEELAKNFDSAQTMLKKGAKQAVDNFGKETFALMPDTKVLGSYSSLRDIQNQQNVSLEQAIKIQNEQKEQNKGLTKNAVEAQQSMERMGQEVFKMGNTLMPDAALAVNKFTTSLKEFVVYINEVLGKKGTTGNGIPRAPNAPPNAGATQMESMADQRRSRLEGASQGKPTALPSNLTPRSMKPAAGASGAAAPYNAARDSQMASVPPTPGPGVNVASTSRGLPATQSADDVMKLIRFQGDSLGTRKHFDALDSDVKQKFIDMIAEHGKPIQINAAMRSEQEQQVLYDKWIANGKIGNPVAKPGKSNHNYGRALDLNSSQVTALASSGLLSKYGFNTIPNDPPHIEMAMSGGVFSGPESGYPVMLHGDKETVVTKPQFDEMTKDVKKESVTTAFGKSTNMSTDNPSESSSAILQELLGLMENKFDEMISQLSTGNNIQDKLLRNSMV